jgi:hypothetical protein
MSKKKAFSGSTMTLKDFHGGSIPSDLPLPSAPGTGVLKVADRSVHEKQNTGTNWGGSINRGYSAGDHRGRQGSAINIQRGFEDKVSYLPNSANIGRNFDEDERKPLDSFSRRSANESDYPNHTFEDRRSRLDRFGEQVVSSRSEVKPESAAVGISHGNTASLTRPTQYSPPLQHDLGLAANQDRGSNPTTHHQTLFGHQFAAPLQQPVKQLPNSGWAVVAQSAVSGSDGPAFAPATAAPNAWATRRETDSSRYELAGNDNVSTPPLFAQTVASRFAQASAVDKVSSGRWQSRRPLGAEHNSEQFSHYHQHLDSLHETRKNGLDSGNFTYGFSEGNDVGRRAKTPANVEQNNYNEKEYSFDDCGRNNYRDTSADTARDLPTGLARNIAAEPCLRNKDDSRSVFAETSRANSGDCAHAKLGLNVEYSGYGDVSRNNVEGHADLDKDQITSLGNTVPRQMSPVMDLTEGNRVNNHLKERVLLLPQVENGCEGARSHFNSKSAHESWNLGTSRDSFKSEDAKSTFYSDFKLGSNAAHSSDHEATRNRFATEDVRVSSPLNGHRPTLTENNHASATSVTDASVHVQSDVFMRPKLKLLPRTKPLDATSQTAILEVTENSHGGLMSKSYEYHSAAGSLPVEVSSEGVGNNTQATVKALGPSDFEEENRSSERPKLNLKPRSLSVEQLEASNEKDRKSLFGGARPRELVLKERGVDDVVISSVDPAAVVNSAKGNTTNSKDTDPFDDKEVELNVDSSGSGNNIRQDDRVENIVFDRKVSNRPSERPDSSRSERSDSEKKDYWVDMEKQELQRNFRRTENWRNPHGKDNYKQERRQDLDKQDSWRKSTDSASFNGGPQRSLSSSLLENSSHVPGKYGHGRAASAVELAQAFSRSASHIVNGQKFSSQGSPISKAVPFSRLTDSSVAREFRSSSVQRRINGY